MRKQHTDDLLKVLVAIDDKQLMSDVLENLLTPQEIDEIATRVQIFIGLNNGENHRDLGSRLGVSLGTISRGSRELQYGKNGMKKVLNK